MKENKKVEMVITLLETIKQQKAEIAEGKKMYAQLWSNCVETIENNTVLQNRLDIIKAEADKHFTDYNMTLISQIAGGKHE